VVDRLIQNSGNIDVYVISAEPESDRSVTPVRRRAPPQWNRYAWSVLLVVATTAISVSISRFIAPTNLVMLYLVAVVVAAIYLGLGPAILASTLGVLAFDFFLVEPRLKFTVNDTQYILTFIGLFVVGLVISTSLRGRVSRRRPPDVERCRRSPSMS
jgi:two-component system sensor histidine kinase KdpD